MLESSLHAQKHPQLRCGTLLLASSWASVWQRLSKSASGTAAYRNSVQQLSQVKVKFLLQANYFKTCTRWGIWPQSGLRIPNTSTLQGVQKHCRLKDQ